MSRFLVLTSSPEFERHLATALGDAHDVQVLASEAAGGSPGHLLAQNLGGAIDVMVFGPDVRTEQMLALAAGLEHAFPDIVLVLAAVAAPELTLAAMRSGIRDVLPPDTEPGRDACKRWNTLPKRPGAASRLPPMMPARNGSAGG